MKLDQKQMKTVAAFILINCNFVLSIPAFNELGEAAKAADMVKGADADLESVKVSLNSIGSSREKYDAAMRDHIELPRESNEVTENLGEKQPLLGTSERNSAAMPAYTAKGKFAVMSENIRLGWANFGRGLKAALRKISTYFREKKLARIVQADMEGLELEKQAWQFLKEGDKSKAMEAADQAAKKQSAARVLKNQMVKQGKNWRQHSNYQAELQNLNEIQKAAQVAT